MNSNGAKKRSQLLSILCILTFIGAGLSIVGSALGFSPWSIQKGIDQMHEMIANSFDPSEFSKTEFLKWSFYSNLFSLIAGVVCLVGALLMWNLNKKGYYVYILGWIIQITISILAVPHLNTSDTSTSGLIAVAFNMILMGTFIWLYGKQMKQFK